MSLRRILELLREVFFPKSDHFLVTNLDSLISIVESTLESTFGSLDSDDVDVEIFIKDKVDSDDFHMIVQSFLINARSMAMIVSLALYNHIKIIVRERVIYSRELFNFETYMGKAQYDGKLLKKAVFIKSGKDILAEYFKFHTKQL